MTFAGFNLIKYIEAVLSTYAMAVGLLLTLSPDSHSDLIYQAGPNADVDLWGYMLLTIGVGHASALWLNGRNRALSRTVRAMASLAHFYVSVEFAIMFISGGALWGALTFGLLMPALVLPVMSRTIDDAREALHDC